MKDLGATVMSFAARRDPAWEPESWGFLLEDVNVVQSLMAFENRRRGMFFNATERGPNAKKWSEAPLHFTL